MPRLRFVIGAGPNNDRNAILSEVLTAPGNGGVAVNYVVQGRTP